MQVTRTSLFTRPDTMFGVCQALGEDLGISANWFRVAIAAVVIVNLQAAFVLYAGLAVLVLVSRLVYPSRKQAPAVDETVVATETPVAEAAPKVLAEAA